MGPSMRRKVLASCAAAALGLTSSQSFAVNAETWSLRAGYGYVGFDDWGADDPNGSSIQIYLNYAINDWLSVDLGWFDGSRVTGDVFEAPITIRPDTRTVEPRALLIAPRTEWSFVPGWALYGSVGYAYTSHYYRLVGGTFATPNYTPGETRHEDELFYAAGLSYEIDERWGVNLDYRTMDFSDVTAHSVGIIASYHFR